MTLGTIPNESNLLLFETPMSLLIKLLAKCPNSLWNFLISSHLLALSRKSKCLMIYLAITPHACNANKFNIYFLSIQTTSTRTTTTRLIYDLPQSSPTNIITCSWPTCQHPNYLPNPALDTHVSCYINFLFFSFSEMMVASSFCNCKSQHRKFKLRYSSICLFERVNYLNILNVHE